MIVPGTLVTANVPVSLHSDWCWQHEDSGCREVDKLEPGELGLCLAVTISGYPRDNSPQVLLLTPRATFGWQSPVYFHEATVAFATRDRLRRNAQARGREPT